MAKIFALLLCALTGVMIGVQGISAILWTPLGYFISLFITSQIWLPLLLGIPHAVRLIKNKMIRPAIIGRIILTPIMWIVLLVVVGAIFGYIWPKAANFLYNNLAFNYGGWLGTFGILLSPLSRKTRVDYYKDFDDSYKRFYYVSKIMDQLETNAEK